MMSGRNSLCMPLERRFSQEGWIKDKQWWVPPYRFNNIEPSPALRRSLSGEWLPEFRIKRQPSHYHRLFLWIVLGFIYIRRREKHPYKVQKLLQIRVITIPMLLDHPTILQNKTWLPTPHIASMPWHAHFLLASHTRQEKASYSHVIGS